MRSDPALTAAGPEVVKITGVALSCSRELEGSGFVFAANHVMTNAHVVAGVRNPHVALPAPGAAVLAARDGAVYERLRLGLQAGTAGGRNFVRYVIAMHTVL